MKFFSEITLLVLIVSFLVSCSGSEESTAESSDHDQEIYIFDDSLADSSKITEMEPVKIDTVETVISKPNEHIVQVGAYTTEERAQRFVMLNQNAIEWKMKISYSTKVQLWVVQLPGFTTRAEAEIVRNKLWKLPKFQDAFIVPEG